MTSTEAASRFGEMTVSGLYASAVQIDITAPIGVPMEGYEAREHPSQGIHDPLYAQLLLIDSGSASIMLISLDLLGIQRPITQNIRSGIQEAIGVSTDAIMVACSHTHSGPAGFLPDLPGLRTHADVDLQSIVERQLTGAAIQAKGTLQPVTLSVSSGHVQGIGSNRNNPEEGPLDDELLILRIDGEYGEPIAVVMNYGCHPTVLGHENLLLSADFPGAARSALRRIYPDTCVQFTNGAAGDVSTRFTRRDQTFAEVHRLGLILAGAALETMQKTQQLSNHVIKFGTKDLKLPVRSFPDHEELTARVKRLEGELERQKEIKASHGDMRRIFTQWQGAVGQAQMAEIFQGVKSLDTELQVLTIDDLALIGIPGEPFTSTALEIKRESDFAHTAIVSYCNDEVGYFPDAKSHQAETYEALISPFREDIAALIKVEALSLLQEM
jgi:neutral ceramidase